MRRIRRLPLSRKTAAFLEARTQAVLRSVLPREEAARLWAFRKNKAFAEIREMLGRMATGVERCMYCEDSEGTAIEHFWPRASHPARAFDWENYLLGCSRCNSNFKRDRFPLDLDGKPLLIDPTAEDPLDHLGFSPSTGRYAPLPGSAKGQPSIDVFGLDRFSLTRGRKDAWCAIRQLLVRYSALKKAGEEEEAAATEGALRRYPFSGVFAALLRIAEGPAAKTLIGRECLEVLRSHPEIGSWLGEPDTAASS